MPTSVVATTHTSPGATRQKAPREVHHAADTEDQREAERDEQVVAPEHKAIQHLFDQEHAPGLSVRHWHGSYAGYIWQGFCSRVGARTSSDSLAEGTAAPRARKSHLSLPWPLALTVKGWASRMS
jgi:hypothetical protein